jgi:anti-sigma-K factor RskA
MLAGAYALNSLTSQDRARFERHMARCRDCADRATEFAEVTAYLAAAVPVPPPAGLKYRALSAAAGFGQVPTAAGTGRPPERARISPRLAGLAAAAATTCLVIATVLGLTARDAQRQLSQELQRNHQIAAILTARDAIMLDAPVKTGGNATVVMSGEERALVFAAAGLRRLPASECYELWLIGPSGDHAAGMLPGQQPGKTGPVVAAGLTAGDRLGLSVEPAGGSAHPTSPMLLELAV